MRGTRTPCIVLAVGLWSTSALADAPPPDDTPPEVTIKSPKAGAEIPADAAKISVECDIVEEESDIMKAVLTVDGKEVATLEQEPWTFRDVALEPGEHTLVVSASNYDGSGDSDPVEVTVAEAKPEPEPEPKTETETKTETKPDTKPDTKPESKPDTKTEAKPETKTESEKKGCSVSASGSTWSTAGLAFGLAILSGFVLRRRP